MFCFHSMHLCIFGLFFFPFIEKNNIALWSDTYFTFWHLLVYYHKKWDNEPKDAARRKKCRYKVTPISFKHKIIQILLHSIFFVTYVPIFINFIEKLYQLLIVPIWQTVTLQSQTEIHLDVWNSTLPKGFFPQQVNCHMYIYYIFQKAFLIF